MADEVPVGAVVVSPEGEVIGQGYNTVETERSVSRHAEICALESACAASDNWRLSGCTLYVTLEPCVMCAWALKLARVERVVYGAPDKRMGGFGTVADFSSGEYLGLETEIIPGICEEECSKLLVDFFKAKRSKTP